MPVTLERLNGTEVRLKVTADTKDLQPVLNQVLAELAQSVKVAGFRPGKAPQAMIEREVGTAKVQGLVIEQAANLLFSKSIAKEKLRPLEPPHVEVSRFVPYSTLELVYSFEVFPDIKLPDYKAIRKPLKPVKVTEQQINDVIDSLRLRVAKRSEVKRAAKADDEVTIDMVGKQNGAEVAGTKANDYTVLIGSNRFVPGFETALVGLKADDDKQFDVTFPADYGQAELRGQKVTFAVKVKKVAAIELPTVDDKLAKAVGPFKDLADLKSDIKAQIQTEQEKEAKQALADSLVIEVTDKAKLDLPVRLVAKQQASLLEQMEVDLKNHGETIDVHLKHSGQSRDELEKQLAAQAEQRIKTALVLNAIAEAEGLKVTKAELDDRLLLLKNQYRDPQFQSELDKPASRERLGDQMLVEKAVARLVHYANPD